MTLVIPCNVFEVGDNGRPALVLEVLVVNQALTYPQLLSAHVVDLLESFMISSVEGTDLYMGVYINLQVTSHLGDLYCIFVLCKFVLTESEVY